MFLKSVGILDSNEVEVLAMLEALLIFQVYFLDFHVLLGVESDSSDAVC